MRPLDDAQLFVLNACSTLAPVEVNSSESVGLVLATDVVATEQVPPFRNSAVDGYAVRAVDVASAATTPVELPVVGEIAAGAYSDRELLLGQAVRIMTGAPLPPGADAVVMVENTERINVESPDGTTDGTSENAERVRISESVEPGTAVRLAGDDVQPGDVVFTAGTVVTPAVLGVLASINARTVSVFPAAVVAVLSTGDELVEEDRPLQPGEIRESNRTMLVGEARAAGCTVVDFGVVPDDEAKLEHVLREAAATCDAIITSGGVSMGDYDVVKAVLGRIADMHWMQIAIKPAKPFAFGTLDSKPVFGLPGNPVSSLVSFEMLARPALRKMMGQRRPFRTAIAAIADVDLRRQPDGKTHLLRTLAQFGPDGRVHVRPVGVQGSHQLAATALADAIARVPDGEGVVAGGDVEVVLLRPL